MFGSAYVASLQTKLIEMKTATVSTAVKNMSDFSFSAGKADQAAAAVITARTGGLMVTWDGATDPTATVGHLIPANTSLTIYGNAKIQALRLLREAGTDAVTTISLEA